VYICKKTWKQGLKSYLYTQAHSAITPHRQKVEITQCTLMNEWTNKQKIAYTYDEVFFSLKKERWSGAVAQEDLKFKASVSCTVRHTHTHTHTHTHITGRNLEDRMVSEISQSQKDEYCVIPCVKSGCQGLWEGRMRSIA
jgi:hypothetical protein